MIRPSGASTSLLIAACAVGCARGGRAAVLPRSPCETREYRDETEMDRCRVEANAGGAFRLDVHVEQCDSNLCRIHRWAHVRASGRTIDLRPLDGRELDATPDGRFVVGDAEIEDARGYGIRLLRVDLASGAATPFADCMSPRLSPGRRWFVCRSARGDVLRVPIAGGAPELVAAAKTDEIAFFDPVLHEYPGPVSFTEDGFVEFTIPLAEGTSEPRRFLHRRATWRE